MSCYSKSHHNGHKVFISHGTSGCGDCGDPLSWSESGFCSDHSVPETNPEQTQLDDTTRIKLISVFKSAFYYCYKFAFSNKQYFNNIIDFLTQIVFVGDATRRCVSLAYRDSFDIIQLFTNRPNLDKNELDNFHRFISAISSDNIFRLFFTETILNNYTNIVKTSKQFADDSSDSNIFDVFFDIIFYSSTPPVITQLINESKIDWFNILNDSFDLIFTYKPSQMTSLYFKNSCRSSSFDRLYVVFKAVLKAFDKNNLKIVEIIENLAEVISKSEFLYPVVRVFDEKIDDLDHMQMAVFDLNFASCRLLRKFTKKDIFTKKPLLLLKNFFDSERFKLIDKPINDQQIYFHSVLSKNVDFTQTYLTHLYAFICLDLKEKKKLYDYISEVTDDIEVSSKEGRLFISTDQQSLINSTKNGLNHLYLVKSGLKCFLDNWA